MIRYDPKIVDLASNFYVLCTYKRDILFIQVFIVVGAKHERVESVSTYNVHHPGPPDKGCVTKNYFPHFSTKTYVVGTQKNRLTETLF